LVVSFLLGALGIFPGDAVGLTAGMLGLEGQAK